MQHYYNTIEDQKLTHANQLTVYDWNRIINILKTQSNNNTTDIEYLNTWYNNLDTTTKTTIANFNTRVTTVENTLKDKVDSTDIVDVAQDKNSAPISSSGVYKELQEVKDDIPEISVEGTNGALENIIFEGNTFSIPTTSFEIEYELKNGVMYLRALKFNYDKYTIETHEPVIVDNVLNPKSHNAICNSAVAIALNSKVEARDGFGLSSNDFTEMHMAQISEAITDTSNLKNAMAKRIIDINTNTSAIKQIQDQLKNLGTTDNSELLRRITAIEEILKSDDVNLDTLQEIVNALTNDESGLERIISELSGKVTKVDGKQLSTNDFTDTYKYKLDNLETIINNAINVQIISILNTDVED